MSCNVYFKMNYKMTFKTLVYENFSDRRKNAAQSEIRVRIKHFRKTLSGNKVKE